MLARFKFLATPGWLALSAAGVVVMIVCALLSQWQWGRAEQRAEANARIEAATDPADLDRVLPAGAELDESALWTLVEATGTFDADSEIVLRTRTNNSQNGYEIVTPLILSDGTALLVDRGFVASETAGGLPEYPHAPSGEVTVVGRVFESEPAGGTVTREDGHLEARRLDLGRLGEELDYELRGAWIGLTEPEEGLRALETPSFRAWQNYSYAVQWALFAVMVPVGWTVLVRRELRDRPGGEVNPPRRTGSSSTAE